MRVRVCAFYIYIYIINHNIYLCHVPQYFTFIYAPT